MCKGEREMDKSNLKQLYIITISCIVVSVTSILLSMSNLYLLTHNEQQEKLEFRGIAKTESSLVVYVNDQELHMPKEKLEDYFLIDMDDIIDWNTDGEEIAISLKNGNELYATQSENIYAPKFKRYVGFDEIQDIAETETTYEITTKDGNTYTVNK